jgi:hypothetical protein
VVLKIQSVLKTQSLFSEIVDRRRMIVSSSFSLNRIATALPEHDVHDAFGLFAEQMLADPRLRKVFRRIVNRADVAHRCLFLDPQEGQCAEARAVHCALRRERGCATSLGAGLTAETMRFHVV